MAQKLWEKNVQVNEEIDRFTEKEWTSGLFRRVK